MGVVTSILSAYHLSNALAQLDLKP